ncbi:hypothetical protein J6590_098419, partial [Homalodisca vitripennis]
DYDLAETLIQFLCWSRRSGFCHNVLRGDTGSGKTTQVPQYIIDTPTPTSSTAKSFAACQEELRLWVFLREWHLKGKKPLAIQSGT